MQNQIRAAQSAHATWKIRLKSAIASGGAELEESTVRADDRCDFGRWLHGQTVPAAVRDGADYAEVVRLHAAFHAEAAEVVARAQRGDREGAESAMKFGGTFSRASAQLDSALTRWSASS
jgi:hypothetical protein